MKLYHLTNNQNVSSILREGLRVSPSGTDGPGVYAWAGPREFAMRNADNYCEDCNYKLSEAEYNALTMGLSVLELDVPADAETTMEWEDYVVLKEAVSPECITFIGIFGELRKQKKSQANRLNKMVLE